MSSKKLSYHELKDQLDVILGKLQSEDLDVDEALQLHAQAKELIKELEVYLKNVSLKITKK